jgi:dCMP deaminase
MKFGRDKMEAKKLNRYDKAYLRIATEWGVCPIVNANKWAIIVRDRMIISDGYNGTPTGFEKLRGR